MHLWFLGPLEIPLSVIKQHEYELVQDRIKL